MYDDDLYSYIRKMIYEETIYLRHYYGVVVNNIDPVNPKSGKVQCLVEELGWNTPDLAAWCNPRQMNSMSVPNLLDTVEIYFMNADCERPVYMGLAAELESRPKSYTAPTKAVIYEHPITGDRITFNLLTKSIDVIGELGTSINISAGVGGFVNLDGETSVEFYVKGTTIMVEHIKLTALLTALMAIISGPPIPEPGMGAPSAFQAALAAATGATPTPTYSASQLSTKIKGN